VKLNHPVPSKHSIRASSRFPHLKGRIWSAIFSAIFGPLCASLIFSLFISFIFCWSSFCSNDHFLFLFVLFPLISVLIGGFVTISACGVAIYKYRNEHHIPFKPIFYSTSAFMAFFLLIAIIAMGSGHSGAPAPLQTAGGMDAFLLVIVIPVAVVLLFSAFVCWRLTKRWHSPETTP
jgi:hypothetical protein